MHFPYREGLLLLPQVERLALVWGHGLVSVRRGSGLIGPVVCVLIPGTELKTRE